ncbi:hypothetical protein MSG28_002016 [Choristoneura fumiferana]|uniref:Uncharacterized protein n=1 Tax=Choristoneura fumiferana TaxID=7141 RepID=A0ACC0JTW0_CHOFU|nr:hypothetical protein MSG28_002016 [Choristoneura fumiferana]
MAPHAQRAVAGWRGAVADAGNIDTIIKKKKEKSASRVLQSVQPYILVLGKLHDFSALYIVIDDVKYSFESAAKAFDQRCGSSLKPQAQVDADLCQPKQLKVYEDDS